MERMCYQLWPRRSSSAHTLGVAIVAPWVGSIFAFLSLVVLSGLRPLDAADRFEIPGEYELQERLEQRATLDWQQMPLRQGLERTAQRWNIAWILDRRIDPQQPITISLADGTVKEFFDRLAREAGAGVGQVGATVYFGPERTAQRVATVVEIHRDQIDRLAPELRRRWLDRDDFEWKKLAEPRQLCARICERLDCRIEALEAVPHDLWADGALPASNACEQLTLVLAQFDLDFEIGDGGRSIRIVRMPKRPLLERTYAVEGDPKRLAERWRRLAPNANVTIRNARIVVQGAWEEHQRLRRPRTIQRNGKQATDVGANRYDLRVKATPARRLIETVARRLEFEVVFDDAIPSSMLDRPIDVAVRQVTAIELMQAVIEAARLRYDRKDDRWTIMPPG